MVPFTMPIIAFRLDARFVVELFAQVLESLWFYFDAKEILELAVGA